MLGRTVMGMLAAFRTPRAWFIVVAFYLVSGFVLTSPFALVLSESVGRVAFHEMGDFALWRWLTRLQADSFGIASGAAFFPMLLALIVWQFLVGGLLGILRHARSGGERPRFISEGARLFLGNVAITLLSWLPLVALGLVLGEQAESFGIALAEDPDDAHSMWLLIRAVLWVVGLVVLTSVWSDIACGYLIADDRPRPVRSIRRAAATLFLRPFSSVAIVLWLTCGTAAIASFSFFTQLANEPGSPASPTIALTLLNATLLACVRLGSLGAAAELAWAAEEPSS